MKGIIDAIIAILFILFGLDIGRELIQKTERCITINQLIRIANGIGLIINLTTKRKK